MAATILPKNVAVLVVHGMGQQIPFETLDAVAHNLGAKPDPHFRRVSLDGQRLARVELRMEDATTAPMNVHLYEAYWAPLTEGQIGLGGVMAFLWRAGLNGVFNGLREFDRWIFGRRERFAPPIRTVVFVLVALAVVGSLVVMNGAIAAVAAAMALYHDSGGWLTRGLRGDLTTVFTWVLAAALAFMIALALNRLLRRRTGARAAGVLAVALFSALVGAIVQAGVAIPLLALYHAGHPDAVTALPAWVGWITAGASRGATVVLAGAIILVTLSLLGTISVRTIRELVVSKSGWFSAVVTALFIGLVLSVAIDVAYFAGILRGSASSPPLLAQPAAIWLILLAVSAYVRSILVQYVGDVAIYVQPQALDRYSDTRTKIKTSVGDVARAIYRAREGGAPYDAVMLVGHSLGSVIAYDTLNLLLWEDSVLPANERRDVARRTKLLLTFGSPLDKTAFFFTAQGRQRGMEVRQRLAVTGQPIIEAEANRTFRWINIHSRWDVISGKLDYYDRPRPKTNAGAVENVIDREATTFFAAHIEYWDNQEVFKALRAVITGTQYP